MYKVGLSSCGFELTRESFEALKKNRIEAIEISMDAKKYPQINYQEVKALSEQYGIKLWSYHLPYMPFEEIDISSMEKAVRDHTVAYYSELIQKATDIGVDKFVVHPSAEPIEEHRRKDRMFYSMQSLDRLAEIAAHNGAVIAVEDQPRTSLGNSAAEIRQLVSANPALRVCFDTNHLLVDDNLNFVERLADKIVTVHISDYDFINERHWLPGEGKINWFDLVTALETAGYNGIWMYEINLVCPKTILRSRDLTFADFYQNAMSIFNREKPQIFSTPKENLGMWE